MNSLKRSKRMKYVAFIALAITLASSLSNAQDLEGKFNLPFTARWGGAVLTPGQYSFTCRSGTGSARIVVRRGPRTLGIFLAYAQASNQSFSDPSYLTATLVGGSYRITSLQLSEPGLSFHFAIPKREVLEASQATQVARSVPLVRAHK